ncbi:TPA: DUF3987 domain-containing protein [Klebsiella aerogenes]|uniref:YfjI family protein n=1 Tax=Klebsiella aerogenes TaxID=548 RepID=UPI00388FA4CB|nr:DUF3987 domain-containing protein [Klebsiella aerogenes]HCM1709146.1 DUF3987 domain-containing protein [Klebsiella aerogenes]
MQNLLPYTVIPKMPEPYIPVQNRNPEGYPVCAFPPVMRDVIDALYNETGIPAELIAGAVLAAASLACQAHIEVVPPHSSDPMHCALYLLTLAVSGEGKTSISKKVMKPFYRFSEQMKQQHDSLMKTHLRADNIWKIHQKALTSNLYTAIKNGYEGMEEERLLDEHAETRQQPPARLAMLYDDTTAKALLEGLSRYSEAGVVSDEAITFFKGYLKNNLGLLNKAWDGETYEYHRPGGEEYDINACLTLALMVQPPVFENYCRNHGELSKGSGFLSRFLYINTISTLGRRRTNTGHAKSDEALNVFHQKINQLLDKQKVRFYSNDSQKQTLRLSDDATAYWAEKQSELSRKAAPGQQMEHISEITAKAGANALRVAAILTYMYSPESLCISRGVIQAAFNIVEWHLEEAERLFFPSSERNAFMEDVYEMFRWLKEKFLDDKGYPFRKNEVNRNGPNRLRDASKSQSVLEQLIALGLICFIRPGRHSAVYIAMPSLEDRHSWCIPPAFLENGHNPIIASPENVTGRYGFEYFDFNRLEY